VHPLRARAGQLVLAALSVGLLVSVASPAGADTVAAVPRLVTSPKVTTADPPNAGRQTASPSASRWVTSRVVAKRRSAEPGYPVEEGLTANAIAVHRAARAAWPQITTYYGYRNDPGSDHYTGKALDLMIPNYSTAGGRALGDQVADWAVAHQSDLHIQYVIWDQHIWNVSRASEGWRLMADRGSDSANHKNHVHISVQ